VEIRVQEKTRVLSRHEIAAAFEPGFQARDGRVRAGNWDLYIARQIIQAHGGEIRSKATPKPEQPSQSCSLAEQFRYTKRCCWDAGHHSPVQGLRENLMQAA
jgi:signal transduction histidine kinase